MKVVWSNLAEQQLDQSIAFVSDIWGKAIGQHLLQESRRISKLLSSHPHIGHPESLLEGRSIKDSTIHIAAIWDTRRDPSALTDEVSFE